MIPLTLAEIAQATGGTLDHITDPAALVTGPLSFDSRHVAAGGLFACLTGRALDGHDFADQAVRDGAAAALAARSVGAPAVTVPDVLEAMGQHAPGVTGPAGRARGARTCRAPGRPARSHG